MTDDKQHYEYLQRFGLDAGRIYYWLVQEIVNQLGKAEYSDKYESEYPEVHIKTHRNSAAVFQDNSQYCSYVAPDQETQPTPTFDEAGYPSFDIAWNDGVKGEMAKHDYGYRLTDHDLTEETILEASVTYNEEEGYYTLKLKLDLEKAPEKITLPNLKASSGMDNAAYTKLDQTIEIWDNGYPRYFLAEDTWKGMIESELVFSTTYYFDEYWTDIANYQYMSDYCKLMD